MSYPISSPIAISSDHAGFDLKLAIIQHFKQYDFHDLGCENATDRCDYPDQADLLAKTLQDNDTIQSGIIICGSGIGISIAANRHKHIRAALCHNVLSAQLSRMHNDANVLALGARLIDEQTAFNIVINFINSSFEGGRHLARVEKLY